MAKQSFDSSLFPDKESLEEAVGAFSEGQEKAEKGNPIGTFNATIISADLGRSQSSDRLQIHYELELLTGEPKGETLHKYDGLATPDQVSITLQQLKRLGVKTAGIDLEQLPAILLDLKGKTISITTKQNGEYYNIYFQRMLGDKPSAGRGKKSGSFK